MYAVGKRTNNGDMISDLDGGLMSNILERLPLKDAIRTSMLSHKWRFSWTRMRKLVFDEALFDSLGNVSETRLSRIVERVLMFHQSSLQEFVLYIPPDFRPNKLYLNGMFFSLSKKAVQKLEVRSGQKICTSYFQMPCYFFECQGLSHLILSAHALNPLPNFQGFCNLVNLELDRVAIEPRSLATLISKAPKLERLSLTGIFDIFADPFDISAPTLRILEIKEKNPNMIILKDTPKLTIVSLQCLEYRDVERINACSISTLLHSSPKMEELTFDLPLFEPSSGKYPNNLDQGFESLVSLNLCRVSILSSQKDILFVFCLLRSSPKLKMLHISLTTEHIWSFRGSAKDKAAAECLEAEGKKDNKFNNLRKVKISGVIGLKSEIMLVKVILSCCMFIEALVIEPSEGANSEAEKQMAWEINRCRRASTLVEVIYSKPKQ